MLRGSYPNGAADSRAAGSDQVRASRGSPHCLPLIIHLFLHLRPLSLLQPRGHTIRLFHARGANMRWLTLSCSLLAVLGLVFVDWVQPPAAGEQPGDPPPAK